MMLLKKSLLAVVVLAGASVAQAGIIEIRGGAGISSSNADSFEDKANSVGNGGIHANELETYNADIFVNLPVLPIGFGLRQEWLNVSDSGNGGDDLDLKAQNLSLLVDFRLIDTVVYVGPIISIGHPSAKVDYKTGTTSISDDLEADQLSYSAGLEAGVKLSSFIIGAETGYQSLKLKTESSSSSIKSKVDLSGFYGKIMLGFSFL